MGRFLSLCESKVECELIYVMGSYFLFLGVVIFIWLILKMIGKQMEFHFCILGLKMFRFMWKGDWRGKLLLDYNIFHSLSLFIIYIRYISETVLCFKQVIKTEFMMWHSFLQLCILAYFLSSNKIVGLWNEITFFSACLCDFVLSIFGSISKCLWNSVALYAIEGNIDAVILIP